MEDTLIKQLSKLEKNEKLILVEAFWDSIASDSDKVEVPEHHQSIIEQRLQSLNEDKVQGKSWDEIRSNYL